MRAFTIYSKTTFLNETKAIVMAFDDKNKTYFWPVQNLYFSHKFHVSASK